VSDSPLPEQDGPTFNPTTHWCDRHREPFRERWPEGWGLAMMAVFEECVLRPDIIAACTSPGADEADPRMLHRVLLEHSPLCCLVGDDTTAKWTRLSLGPLEDFQAALDELRLQERTE
jgi:hypothetical protein